MTEKEPIKYEHTLEIDSSQAPSRVVPKLLEWFQPNSVVDVGCGIGTWLKSFEDLGVKHVLGIEGDHLNRNLTLIDNQKIISHDLELPFHFDTTFDLVMSLEVAEHISPDSANVFIQSLVNLGEVILFSAAVPNQGGQHHLNEQWVEYWQEKFLQHQFHFYDVLRPLFWKDDAVDWYYKQNMFLVIKEGVDHPFKENQTILNYIHPELFTQKVNQLNLLNEKVDLKTATRIWLRILAKKLGVLDIYRTFVKK